MNTSELSFYFVVNMGFLILCDYEPFLQTNLSLSSPKSKWVIIDPKIAEVQGASFKIALGGVRTK